MFQKNKYFNLEKDRIPFLLASAKSPPHYIMSDAPPWVTPRSGTVVTLF